MTLDCLCACVRFGTLQHLLLVVSFLFFWFCFCRMKEDVENEEEEEKNQKKFMNSNRRLTDKGTTYSFQRNPKQQESKRKKNKKRKHSGPRESYMGSIYICLFVRLVASSYLHSADDQQGCWGKESSVLEVGWDKHTHTYVTCISQK